MTIRTLAQVLGLGAVTALWIIACSPMPRPGDAPPGAPILLSLEIPSDAFGRDFAGTTPALPRKETEVRTPAGPKIEVTPANYFVLPLLPTTAPIVRAVLRSPYPSSLAVTVVDATRAETATLPQIPRGNTGPTTGFFQVIDVTPNNPATWHIVIRYPNSFQGSKSISTRISDTVAGVASEELEFVMSFRGSTVALSIVTENNDGKVTSNPPGIDCPGTCSFDFLNSTSVILTQSVTSNSTEFIGWTGNCAGSGGTCTVQLLTSSPPSIPVNSAVAANFRIHTNAPIPAGMSCPAAPVLPGKQWVTQPNCGKVLFATLQCDTAGYFCCGGQTGKPTARCMTQNQTEVTCSLSAIAGGPPDQQLIQPGGCYVDAP